MTWRQLRINELPFSVRLRNMLARYNYTTLGQLHLMSKEDYDRIPNLGKKSYHEIQQMITAFKKVETK